MSGEAGRPDGRVVCAGCGCLCDDVPLEADPDGSPGVGTDCPRGREWFRRHVFPAARGERRPAVDGEPASLTEAAARAAELLAGAVHPRVSGLDRLPLEAQRRLVEVADRAGAQIDAGPSPGHLGTVLAVQRDGGPFLTLGELRERVDCLVLWFAEPARTHPRLLERFYPRRDGGGGDRTLVAVGPRAGESGADLAVTADPEDSLPLLWLLRLLADDPSAPERDRHPLGADAARIIERLGRAGAGAWIYGGGDTAEEAIAGRDAPPAAEPAGPADPVETAGLLRLLRRLNEEAPWGARPLAGEGNPVGAEAVLTWQSGYPTGVSYRDGRPRYAGDAYAAHRPGAGEGVDVVLRAGGRPTCPPGAACIWLDTGETAGAPGGGDRAGSPADGGGTGDVSGGSGGGADVTPTGVAVRIPVPPPGARAGETLLRMDGLSVRSPGVPGAGTWGGTQAEEALEAVLGEMIRIRGEE